MESNCTFIEYVFGSEWLKPRFIPSILDQNFQGQKVKILISRQTVRASKRSPYDFYVS